MVADHLRECDDFLYNMGNNGYVLVINNVNFDMLPTRYGSDNDVELLRKFFVNTIFWNTFDVMTDMTVQDMKDYFKSISMYDFSCFQAFFVFILSHGNKYGILGKDSLPNDCDNVLDVEQDVFPLFRGSRCSTLYGKPKVFILQASRGNNDDFGSVTDHLMDSSSTLSLSLIHI